MMNIYQDWGFQDSPFKTTALPPSDLGSRLLVGRDKELKSLLRRLYNPPKIVTIEGLNGVGKTSLVNVAAYKAYKAYLDRETDCLFIPCRQTFQLKPDQDAGAFIDEVLMAVAQTLIDEAKKVKTVCESIKTDSLDKWLNSPQIQTLQGSFSILAVGGGGGITAETNTSTGFERSGFRKAVLRWLSELFPSPQDGGVICTIDNLELLQTSEAARKLLEQLRDELLTVPGLRWVLCGALGIVLGTASSPRLEGFLNTPIEISGVDEALASEILTSRLETFALDTHQPYMPLLSQDFESLYDVLNKNLRSVLGRADNYCQWVADRDLPNNDSQKHLFFKEWLVIESDSAYRSVNNELRPRAWDVFKYAVSMGGVFSPSDYEEFGFNNIPAMRPHVKDLEDAGLLVSTQDEGDKRRKTIQITPKGWLVNYALGKSS
jgi:DNA-binding MarR family transcriptional regulator